jgi:hypothetical protein
MTQGRRLIFLSRGVRNNDDEKNAHFIMSAPSTIHDHVPHPNYIIHQVQPTSSILSGATTQHRRYHCLLQAFSHLVMVVLGSKAASLAILSWLAPHRMAVASAHRWQCQPAFVHFSTFRTIGTSRIASGRGFPDKKGSSLITHEEDILQRDSSPKIPFTWPELVQIVEKEKNLAKLCRSIEDQRGYDLHRQELKKTGPPSTISCCGANSDLTEVWWMVVGTLNLDYPRLLWYTSLFGSMIFHIMYKMIFCTTSFGKHLRM